MKLAAFGGCMLGLATGWNISNTGAVAEPLASAYGVGLAAVGLFTTALFVSHLVMQIPGGKASDRFGPRRTASSVMSALYRLAATFAGSFGLSVVLGNWVVKAPATSVGFVNCGRGGHRRGNPLLGLAFSLTDDRRIGFVVVAALWAAVLLVLPSRRELGVAPTAAPESR